MKLPFHLIVRTVQLLANLNLIFNDEVYDDLYHRYLKEAGWTSEEYEAALLEYINANWEVILN